MPKHRFDTIAVKGGYDWEDQIRYRTVEPPIIQSVVYPYESADWAADLFQYKTDGFMYGRMDNPTTDIFEKRMAMLEGAGAGIATSSGMAALFMVAHHLAGAGDEITYGSTAEPSSSSP